MGVVDVTVAEYCSFQIAVLIEAKQGVVTFAVEIAVLGRTLLLTVGFADRAVQVQDQLLDRISLAHAIDPFAGQCHQCRHVLRLRKYFGFEAAYLTG